MKTYDVIIVNGLKYLKETNPHEYDKAPEFGSTEWSRFEAKAEREKLPLLGASGKLKYDSGEFDIVEAYIKDGYITYDLDRPFYARNMSIPIVDAAVILTPTT